VIVAEHGGVLEAFVGVRDHQLDAFEAAPDQSFEEGRPKALGFRGPDAEADDLAPPVSADRHRDYRCQRDDAAAFADLQIRGIEPEIGPLALERPLQEGVDALPPVPLRGPEGRL
jgi:hypothetical protein